jgi:hypothetical protein
MALSKDDILSRIGMRIERDEPSEVFGGALRLRELDRATARAASRASDIGNGRTDLDTWNASVFAAGVIDAATGAPLFTVDEIKAWPHRVALWNEIVRIGNAILELSEVSPDALKSGDPAPDAE